MSDKGQFQPMEWLALFFGNNVQNMIMSIVLIGLGVMAILLTLNVAPKIRQVRLFKYR